MKDRITAILKKHRIDIIVILTILIISLLALLFITLKRETGSVAVVKIDNETVLEVPLDKDGQYTLNEGTNVLTVKDGKAYMSYSECKGHQCEKMGKKSKVGEFIECAPNRVKIFITGNSDDGVDLVS